MNNFALWVLALYKRWISPSLPPSCRYVPTCSEYAMEAVDRFGILRGGAMAMCRVLRCHPFVKGGYDPVVNSSMMQDTQQAPSRQKIAQNAAAINWDKQMLTAGD